MKKTLLYAAAASMLFAVSCKETLDPIIIDTGNASDTSYTYVESVTDKQTKRILIEELTGVKCVNCPGGAVELERLKTVYPDKLSIISLHNGTQFTTPIKDVSTQDFRTNDGDKIYTVWGPGEAKPCSVVDRLKLGLTGTNRIYVAGASAWQTAIETDISMHPTSPVNLTIESKYDSEKDQYNITATVKYTEAVSSANALQIFVSEDNIIDAQEYPDSTAHHYDFHHVFRKAVTTPEIGKYILDEMTTKEAGRVWVFKTSFKIDPTDEKQKFWKPENMHVTAFVSIAKNADDKRVLQVQETSLK